MYFGLKVYIAGVFRVAEFYYYIAVFRVLLRWYWVYYGVKAAGHSLFIWPTSGYQRVGKVTATWFPSYCDIITTAVRGCSFGWSEGLNTELYNLFTNETVEYSMLWQFFYPAVTPLVHYVINSLYIGQIYTITAMVIRGAKIFLLFVRVVRICATDVWSML